MYERSYGAKYDAALQTPDIAKRFRADVKEAIADGALPPRRARTCAHATSPSSPSSPSSASASH